MNSTLQIALIMNKVTSSSIEAYAYDSKIQTLFIKFKDSYGVYAYSKVPHEVVQAGFETEGVSPGRFLFTEIKGKYPFVRVQ